MRVGDLADAVAQHAVVDRRVERVRRRLGELDVDVEQERLPVPALVLVRAVEAGQLDAVQLDLHAIALATVSASTCSFTSCARRIVAPRS